MLREVEILPDSGRGQGGFGSIGMANAIAVLEDRRDLIWREHLPAHWGADKIFWSLKRKGLSVPLNQIRKIIMGCKVYARFRRVWPRGPLGQPPFSLEPGHTVYMDFIGPVTAGRGGVRYIFSIVDSCTRMGGAWKFKATGSQNVITGLQRWTSRYGPISRIVSDNAAYFTSDELKRWCEQKGIEQLFIAPHRHESVGLVERFQQTLVDRLRKMVLDQGGSWGDHLEDAVRLINQTVNRVTGFSPQELWGADLEARELALNRSTKERRKGSEGRRLCKREFFVGQRVIVYDVVAASSREDKFLPLWKGPYELVERVSPSLWRAKELRTERGRGRRPVLVFHQDHLQPWDLE